MRKHGDVRERGFQQLLHEVANGGIHQNDGRRIRPFQLARDASDQIARGLRSQAEHAVVLAVLHRRFDGVFSGRLHQIGGQLAVLIHVRS